VYPKMHVFAGATLSVFSDRAPGIPNSGNQPLRQTKAYPVTKNIHNMLTWVASMFWSSKEESLCFLWKRPLCLTTSNAKLNLQIDF